MGPTAGCSTGGSGRPEDHKHGVGMLLLPNKLASAPIYVSDRLLLLLTLGGVVKVTLAAAYASMEPCRTSDKDVFYTSLRSAFRSIPSATAPLC